MRTLKILALPSIALLLASCGTSPVIRTERVEVPVPIPVPVEIDPCERPEFTGSTWGEIAEYASTLLDAIDTCNERIDAAKVTE